MCHFFKGATADSGIVGSPGLRGPPGVAGQKGEPGAIGSQGSKGDQVQFAQTKPQNTSSFPSKKALLKFFLFNLY